MKPKPWERDETSSLDSKSTEEAVEYPSTGPKEDDPLLPKGSAEKVDMHKLGPLAWMSQLSKIFGYELLGLLFIVQHVIKGLVHSMTVQAESYLFRAYGAPAPQMQIFGGVAALPWAMKPIIGLASDVLPIWGYNKSPYMLLTTVLGTCSLLAVGLFNEATMPIRVAIICLFLTSLQMSTCDLLSEAKYAEKVRQHPAYGPALLSYVWFGLQVGGLVAVMSCGHVIHEYGPRACYLICVIPAASVVGPVLLGWVKEGQKSRAEIAEAWNRLMDQREACILCVVMLIGTLTLVACGIITGDAYINCMVAFAVAVVVLIAFSVLLSPVIAKFNAFSLIQTSLCPSMGGAAYYFFTDSPDEYADGPHFSEFFFISVMGTAGAVFSLLGIYYYQRYLSDWKYRNLLVLTNLIFSLLSSFDLLLFTRTNVKLGIPDSVFVLSSTALGSVLNQWRWMPGIVILSYLCPKGMEATMYALLAGCHNLGNMVAASCGAWMLELLGCKPNGSPNESKQFENLWIMSGITTLMPLLTILLLFWLIPDAKQNESLIDGDSPDATAGSLWKACLSRQRVPGGAVRPRGE